MTMPLAAEHPAEGKLALAFRRWRLQRRFRHKLGYAGNFEAPRTYQEKIQFRKLYGNHSFYALVADKYRVRDYVAERAGEKYLIPQLAVCDRLTPEIIAPLPPQFIIQANHGCKWQRIVRHKGEFDVGEAVRYFNRLMRRSYGWKGCDYHYRLIPPKIVINQLLIVDGDVPADYCFYCYHGTQGFDYALAIALPGTVVSMHFDRHWNVWEGDFTEEQKRKYVRPPKFDEMVDVARALSRDFDFVRVDLYNVEGRVFFGELTCTPSSGLVPIDNAFRAAQRTDMWQLAVDNELLYRKPRAK
jgi:hypothetical protein